MASPAEEEKQEFLFEVQMGEMEGKEALSFSKPIKMKILS
jgi:hypothetical protein